MSFLKLTVVLCVGVLASSSPAADARRRGEEPSMESILALVESDDFIREVSPGSDAQFDVSVLLRTPAFRTLMQCDEECLRAVEERARRLLKQSRWRQRALNVYFVLFEKRSYVPGIPVICEYLNSLQDSERAVWILGFFAFTLGFDAIEVITGARSSQGPLGELFRLCHTERQGSSTDEALFEHRHEIARAALDWHRNRVSSGSSLRLCPKCKSPIKAGKTFCTRDGTPVPQHANENAGMK